MRADFEEARFSRAVKMSQHETFSVHRLFSGVLSPKHGTGQQGTGA